MVVDSVIRGRLQLYLIDLHFNKMKDDKYKEVVMVCGIPSTLDEKI
jgi:hypothetical protein